ncbi:SWI/SNF complex component SNF12-like protein [Iris pallida]|uniref:SWI/SNF complex component SNF12-like protein n=1 Tax=Iris pallida TaxID=29817 RepID=A0AAX6HP69_IRIPA|nr:SWI/SNF complex component SNF12-like protein [Iris pallida]
MASNANPSIPRTLAGSPLGNPSFSHHIRPPTPYQSLFQSPPSSQQQQFQVHFPNPNPNPNSIRRAPPSKSSSGPGTPATNTNANNSPSSSSFKSAELTPAARRKKRKLPDKQVPDRIATLLPESALYTQLLEFESRVDSALSRKKLDIQDSLKNPPSLQRTLRIYIFNTFSNRTNRPPASSDEPPSWSLKIIGRILEDPSDPEPPKPNPSYPKFSAFFKRVTISLDPALYQDNPTIVWENSRSPAPLEGFEVKRKGDKEFTASVCLEMNYAPEKYKLSLPLMEVLGIEVDNRARIIAGIWHYVKAKKLQNPSDPSFFACDPLLKKVFGEEKMKFAMVSQKISQHLSHPQPIQLEHKIRLSGNSAAGNVCYDVLVDVPFPVQKEMAAFLSNTEKHKEIEACDEVICASIKKIHEHRRRRAFFLGFSQSPVEFINALIASQSRDLKLVTGDGSRNAEKERRSDFYNQPWVEDAVIRYLNRKPTGGSDVPGST